VPGVDDNVEVVRLLWSAVREEEIDAIVGTTVADVGWRPTAVTRPRLHGHDELRAYLTELYAARRLADAHPFSFEALGDCVIVSGALLVRRHPQRVTTMQRWWVYRVRDGKIATAGSHLNRAEAVLDARRRGH
jgi:ketosteroid isomerase-like protein